MSISINSLTAPDAYTPQSTIENEPTNWFVVTVVNQPVIRQLKITSPNTPGMGGWWEENNEAEIVPGLWIVNRVHMVGIRFRAATLAANLGGQPQAIINVEAVTEQPFGANPEPPASAIGYDISTAGGSPIIIPPSNYPPNSLRCLCNLDIDDIIAEGNFYPVCTPSPFSYAPINKVAAGDLFGMHTGDPGTPVGFAFQVVPNLPPSAFMAKIFFFNLANNDSLLGHITNADGVWDATTGFFNGATWHNDGVVGGSFSFAGGGSLDIDTAVGIGHTWQLWCHTAGSF
jgi:hypothetical protein